MSLLDACRAANVALLSVAILTLVVWLSDTWGGLSRGRRISMVSIRLLLVGGVAGSAIKYATNAPTDISIVVVTVSSVGIIIGQWLARNDPSNQATQRAVARILDHVEHNVPCEHPGCITARIELRALTDGRVS